MGAVLQNHAYPAIVWQIVVVTEQKQDSDVAVPSQNGLIFNPCFYLIKC